MSERYPGKVYARRNRESLRHNEAIDRERQAEADEIRERARRNNEIDLEYEQSLKRAAEENSDEDQERRRRRRVEHFRDELDIGDPNIEIQVNHLDMPLLTLMRDRLDVCFYFLFF